ncbi:hypothetical protein ABTX34_34400 [Streptomyces sp. NPDC096538]|uniref:hypothetical protein n=1 Tax=Streptomyces sp. NPDC096538 TaxID=3155427 RepID=UPI00332D1320
MDADKLTVWLAEHVACKERRPEQVRVELLARCRAESFEPPTPGRCDRIVGAALRVAEETLTARISGRLMVESTERIVALFADVAPKVVAGWRAPAAVESPSHLRTQPLPLRVTLLSALLHEREREITDTLVERLISTVHRIGARAEKKVTEQLVNASRRCRARRTSSSSWPRRRMRCGC